MFGEDKILKIAKGIRDVKDFVNDITKCPGELISLPLQYGTTALDYFSLLKITNWGYGSFFVHKNKKEKVHNHEDIKSQDLKLTNENVISNKSM